MLFLSWSLDMLKLSNLRQAPGYQLFSNLLLISGYPIVIEHFTNYWLFKFYFTFFWYLNVTQPSLIKKCFQINLPFTDYYFDYYYYYLSFYLFTRYTNIYWSFEIALFPNLYWSLKIPLSSSILLITVYLNVI